MARATRMTEEEVETRVPKIKRYQEEDGEIVKRPRSLVTVFSDGTVISLEGFKACNCPFCKGAIRPMSDFGYRRMANGIIRPQGQCKRGR